MPIRPELRKFYRGAAWRATRLRILTRAGHRCEQCGKPNGAMVETFSDRAIGLLGRRGMPVMFWRKHGIGATWRDWMGAKHDPTIASGKRCRVIRVQIGVAHLNHVPGDDRDENLRALCNWCHLVHDRGQHHQTRGRRKDAKRPLLQEANCG